MHSVQRVATPLDPRSDSPTTATHFGVDGLVPPAEVIKNPHYNHQEFFKDKENRPDYLQLILTAPVYQVAITSPLTHAINLSNKLGVNIYLKREDLQPVFSFKLRGAFNKMSSLSKEERERGVVCCSAGNHAQGVALAAKQLGIEATICMPLATPPIKVKNVARLGGKVVLHGNDFDAAKVKAQELSETQGLVDIRPFDDPLVIAGQGTVATEILRQLPSQDLHSLSAVFVCVGGGGLLAGIAVYLKRLLPHVKIVGVETYDADAMTKSLQLGQRVVLPEVGLFADGAAVKVVGEETFRLAKSLVDEMVLVSTDQVCAAIKDVFEDTRSILEPAGALGVAGMKKYLALKGIKEGTFVAVTSGANMNFDRLRFVAERADVGEAREVLMSVIIPEEPGSFMKLYSTISPRNVTEFSYRYSHPKLAHIFMSFQTLSTDPQETTQIIEALEKQGMKSRDLRDNEMAKGHLRYLMGGRNQVENERLLRFSFPEKPGALKTFLTTLPSHLNVSLFHYRNYGADVGKVLVGIQVPPKREQELQDWLAELKFPWIDESDNEAYQEFLLGLK